MSLWTRSKGSAHQATPAGRYHAAGRDIVCLQCGNRWFEQSQAQLNTAWMTFFNLDWANPSATTLICTQCCRMEWYAREPVRVD